MLDNKKARERPELVYLYAHVVEAWNMFGECVYVGSVSGVDIPDDCHIVKYDNPSEDVAGAFQLRLLETARRKKIDNLKKRLQAKSKVICETKILVPAVPPPRFDEVFMNGQKWLDETAGGG